MKQTKGITDLLYQIQSETNKGIMDLLYQIQSETNKRYYGSSLSVTV